MNATAAPPATTAYWAAVTQSPCGRAYVPAAKTPRNNAVTASAARTHAVTMDLADARVGTPLNSFDPQKSSDRTMYVRPGMRGMPLTCQKRVATRRTPGT